MTASTRCPRRGIERKRAHIVGGGIAGLATAAFLVDDAHMPGKNITIYESAAVNGGCLDAVWDPKAAAYIKSANVESPVIVIVKV